MMKIYVYDTVKKMSLKNQIKKHPIKYLYFDSIIEKKPYSKFLIQQKVNFY